MKRSTPYLCALAAAAALPFALLACGGDAVVKGSDTAPAAKPAAASAAPAPTKVGPEYAETDFIENDRNRDPFRSFSAKFTEGQQRTITAQRKILLSQYSLEELKLVAIVQGGDYPRALLIDPHGKGWVLKRGDYLARAETVHTGGTNGTDYQLNWRVDRVRDGDIVLIREDPAQPHIAPTTRVIPLHPASSNKSDEDLNSESRL